MGAQTQRKASSKDGRPNEKLIRNKNVHTREHLAKRRPGGWIRTNFGLEVDFLIRPHPGWVPQCNERRVRKMGAQTQRKARPQDGCPNATQGASARWLPKRKTELQQKRWAPQRNARHIWKLAAPTQRKARPQDGRPNATEGTCAMQGTSARPQIGHRNATQGTSARWSPKRKTHPHRKCTHKGALG
jgi:hypothetical protein